MPYLPHNWKQTKNAELLAEFDVWKEHFATGKVLLTEREEWLMFCAWENGYHRGIYTEYLATLSRLAHMEPMSVNERVEYMAERFYKDKGVHAPVKDLPVYANQSDREESQRKWEDWIDKFYGKLVAFYKDLI